MIWEKTNLMHKQCGDFLWSSLIRLFVELKTHVTNCYGAYLLCNWGIRSLTPNSTSLAVVCGFPYSKQTNYVIVTYNIVHPSVQHCSSSSILLPSACHSVSVWLLSCNIVCVCVCPQQYILCF